MADGNIIGDLGASDLKGKNIIPKAKICRQSIWKQKNKIMGIGMKHWSLWLRDALAGFTPLFIGPVFYLSDTWKKCAKVNKE